MDLDVHLPSIVAGDDRAFGAWLAGAEEPVRRSLRSFAAVVDTEAVLQEALLRVWQVAPRTEPDGRPNALLRLALRIARNAAIDEVRRARATPMDADALERALHGGEEPVAGVMPDPLLRKVIERCRGRLPPAPRQAFDARVAGGRADRDLADELGMQLNTFLKNVGRARALLVECLGRAGVAVEVR